MRGALCGDLSSNYSQYTRKVNSSEFTLSANQMPRFRVNSLVCIGELLKAHQKPGNIFNIFNIFNRPSIYT